MASNISTKFTKLESKIKKPDVTEAEDLLQSLRKQGVEIPPAVIAAQEALKELRRSGQRCEKAVRELEALKNPSTRKKNDCTALLKTHDKLLSKIHSSYASLHQETATKTK